MRLIRVCLVLASLIFAGSAAGAGGSGCVIAHRQAPSGGGTVAYNIAGEGKPLLLLHGLFAQKEQWNRLLCLLAAGGFTAIAPDLPGYGESSGFSLDDYRLERQAMRLHQFIGTLGYGRYDVAGSSMGGAIAALLVRDYPREVRSLAFIGSPLGVTEWGEGVRSAIYAGVNPFIPIDLPQLALELRLLFVHPPEVPQPVRELLVRDYLARNRHFQQVWDIVNLYDSLLLRGAWGRKPTLILWGREDQIYPVTGASLLKRRMPWSHLIRLPQASHLLLMENAPVVAERCLAFLRRPGR